MIGLDKTPNDLGEYGVASRGRLKALDRVVPRPPSPLVCHKCLLSLTGQSADCCERISECAILRDDGSVPARISLDAVFRTSRLSGGIPEDRG